MRLIDNPAATPTNSFIQVDLKSPSLILSNPQAHRGHPFDTNEHDATSFLKP